MAVHQPVALRYITAGSCAWGSNAGGSGQRGCAGQMGYGIGQVSTGGRLRRVSEGMTGVVTTGFLTPITLVPTRERAGAGDELGMCACASCIRDAGGARDERG